MIGKLVLAFAIAFFTAALMGKIIVPWLRKIKAGQSIKENGPTWHMSKSGTPTMGGVIFIMGVAITCIT
ncbi:MAG: phospho-N-acetylmuramoyl-pentapeptide-transferase, partial [Oscillospiraceae bacterium]